MSNPKTTSTVSENLLKNLIVIFILTQSTNHL